MGLWQPVSKGAEAMSTTEETLAKIRRLEGFDGRERRTPDMVYLKDCCFDRSRLIGVYTPTHGDRVERTRIVLSAGKSQGVTHVYTRVPVSEVLFAVGGAHG